MDHLTLLAREIDGMAHALRTTAMDTAVAACPGWTVRELAGHVTGVHRWVLEALKNEGPGGYDETPDAEGDLAEAYTTAASRMLTRLRELPADSPAWTFNKQDQTAAFWRRRQVLELAVHRWDVSPYEISDEIATDAIDELVDFFLPRGVHLKRTVLPDDARLILRAPHRSWTVGDGTEETVVEGTPHALLLVLYGREGQLPAVWSQTQLSP